MADQNLTAARFVNSQISASLQDLVKVLDGKRPFQLKRGASTERQNHGHEAECLRKNPWHQTRDATLAAVQLDSPRKIGGMVLFPRWNS